MVVFAFVLATSLLADEVSLVKNGSFEAGMDQWGFQVISAKADGGLDSSQHHTGKNSFRMHFENELTANVYAKIGQDLHGLKPDTAYRISCWVKGKNVGGVWIGGGPGWAFREHFPTGTYDWQKVTTYYLTSPGETFFPLMIIAESITDQVWIDDVEFVEDPAKTIELKEKRTRDAKERDEKIHTLVNEQTSHLAQLESSAKEKGLSADSYIHMGFAIAHRFIDRVNGKHLEGADWSLLQMQKVKEVLDRTEKLIGSRKSAVTVERPGPGPVELKDGIFYSRGKPFFFYGYGHFTDIIKDLPNFWSFGASIVQDGQYGPWSMGPDGKLTKDGQKLVDDMKRATANKQKVDVLLSPHYFPDWAIKQAPDVVNGNQGFIGTNIDHPKMREVMSQWIKAVCSVVKEEPSLFSICLSNEPIYVMSGRDKYSLPAWVDYLKQQHGTIEKLNALCGSHYESFEKVPVPGLGMPADIGGQRLFYDWVRFNDFNFANWHKWMADEVHKWIPNARTHAKIMVFMTLGRDHLAFGVDPELFCDATEIAGCDDYAFGQSGRWAYDWTSDELFYDLLHSFHNQTVFNSENHLIPDGSPADHVPMEHTQAVYWQGGLHHQGVTTQWVWSEPTQGALSGGIMLRPANIYGAGKASFDLDRFANEVKAISQQPAKVALLYSPSSQFWQEDYPAAIYSMYTSLNFLGEPITFVSEEQLAQHRAAKVKIIILPRATHVSDSTVAALEQFVKDGGKIIACGDGNLSFDEYHQPRKVPESLRGTRIQLEKLDEATAGKLRGLLTADDVKPALVKDVSTNKPAWGVEYRVVSLQGRRLISLINLTTKPMTVDLSDPAHDANDLLSDESLDISKVTLSPMVPRLLKVK